jgi:hypothetical protein
MRNHCQHASFNQCSNQIKSVEEKLKTGIPESLSESLMKVAYKLLIRDDSTFEELTPQEQQLWTRFETDDIYSFLTGEPDTVPEFCFNWTLVPQLTFQSATYSTLTQAQPTPAPPAPQAPQPPPSPHSSPTPSPSGTRPKTSQMMAKLPAHTDPTGASTSGTQAPLATQNSRNLWTRSKVDYKYLHTGASQFSG